MCPDRQATAPSAAGSVRRQAVMGGFQIKRARPQGGNMIGKQARALLCFTIALVFLVATSQTAQATLRLYQPNPTVAASFVGRGGVSGDGLGQLLPGGSVQVEIPGGSRVVFALLYAATVFGGHTTSIVFSGQTVNLTPLPDVANPGLFSTTRADVTNIVRSTVGSGGAVFNFIVGSDPVSPLLNGVALVVVYENNSLPERSIFILDGGLGFELETTSFTFGRPVNTLNPRFQATLSFGIQHGYQGGAGDVAGTRICGEFVGQFNIVDVNNQRLTSCAGNYDDGFARNGALITVGGVGDSLDVPADPFQRAGDGAIPRVLDDELYDITGFIRNGDTSLSLTTENPSRDDSIFLGIIMLTGEAAQLGTLALPWPFEERVVGDNAWHNHDTPAVCAQDHADGHPGGVYPCGYGDSEGDHESDDAFARDWNWKFGSPPEELTKTVLSVTEGTVIFVENQSRRCGYGNQVIILSSDESFAIRYTHLGSVAVSLGGITQGLPIGSVGGSGCYDTAPHLHVAVYSNLDSAALNRLKAGTLPCGRGPLSEREPVIPPSTCATRFTFVP